MAFTIPVLKSSPSLWELLQVRPSAMTSRMYISPQGRSVMSQLVSHEVQQAVLPFICSRVALYVTAPGVADQEMLAVRLSQLTAFSMFSGGHGAGEREAMCGTI